MQTSTLALTLCLFALFVASTPAQLKPAKAAISPDLWKQIEARAPKPSPQGPSVKRPSSDAEDEHLRGRVKVVVEESMGYQDVSRDEGRRVSRYAEYDRAGNRLREIYFTYKGQPYNMIAYGYLDGERASKSKSFEDNVNKFTVLGGEPEPPPLHPPDERYSYKYEYTYKNGRLAEMQMMLNDGRKGMRYVYEQVGNSRSRTAYDMLGKINWKSVYKLDDKGNEIEMTSVDVRNVYGGDTVYKIRNEAFDSHGNWTQRTWLKTFEKGKKVDVADYTEYRTITYY